MPTSRTFACLVLIILISCGNVLAATDTRTVSPEKMMNKRKSWGLDIGFGTDLLRGNQEQDSINGALSIFKSWESVSAYFSSKAVYQTTPGKTIRNSQSFVVRADHRISGPWKLFGFTTHSRNPPASLIYRGQVGAGPWFDVEALKGRHGLSLALAYQVEHYSIPLFRNTTRLAFRDLTTWDLNENVIAGWDLFISSALDDLSDLRVTFLPYVETAIWKEWLLLKLQGNVDYDHLPRPGLKPTDLEFITSVTIRIGR